MGLGLREESELDQDGSVVQRYVHGCVHYVVKRFWCSTRTRIY